MPKAASIISSTKYVSFSNLLSVEYTTFYQGFVQDGGGRWGTVPDGIGMGSFGPVPQSAMYQADYVNTDNQFSAIGFDTQSDFTGQTGYEPWKYFIVLTGTSYLAANANYAESSEVPFQVGDKYRLIRYFSRVQAEYLRNGEWYLIHRFSQRTSAPLFLKAYTNDHLGVQRYIDNVTYSISL